MKLFFYDFSEFDLSQIIEKSMINVNNISFEISKLNMPRITEIESDNEKKNKNISNINQNIDKKKDLELISNNQKQFHTSESISTFDIITSESASASEKSSSFFVIDLTVFEWFSSESFKRFASTFTALKDIKNDVDESNILPEKVNRKRIRKQTHTAALKNALSGNIDAFHQAFYVFSAARKYYADN